MATEVLRRIAVDDAWAAHTLDAELRRYELDTRDSGLATAIVYGALRVLPSLDEAIDAHAKRTDPYVRAALRAAVFQLRYLERVPARAVVHETVELVRRERGKPVGGFVNAVLRKIARADEGAAFESRLELPRWAAALLVSSVGEARARAFLDAEGTPPMDLRVMGDVDAALAALGDVEPPLDVVRTDAPQSVRVRGGGDPRLLPGFDAGDFYVQELGSQHIVAAVGAQKGERIADACAGRGGKTLALAEAVGPSGSITAIELHEARLEQIPDLAARVGLTTPIELETIDLSRGTGGLPEFDRVLVDAPCSGLGTVHRRPEILLRLSERDLPALAKTQRAILQNAAKLVRPGGTLVYAVCSFAASEGPGAARAIDWPLDPLPGSDDDGWLRLGPWRDVPTDAYQVVRWRRP